MSATGLRGSEHGDVCLPTMASTIQHRCAVFLAISAPFACVWTSTDFGYCLAQNFILKKKPILRIFCDTWINNNRFWTIIIMGLLLPLRAGAAFAHWKTKRGKRDTAVFWFHFFQSSLHRPSFFFWNFKMFRARQWLHAWRLNFSMPGDWISQSTEYFHRTTDNRQWRLSLPKLPASSLKNTKLH